MLPPFIVSRVYDVVVISDGRGHFAPEVRATRYDRRQPDTCKGIRREENGIIVPISSYGSRCPNGKSISTFDFSVPSPLLVLREIFVFVPHGTGIVSDIQHGVSNAPSENIIQNGGNRRFVGRP